MKVFNAEPFAYSEPARKSWVDAGYDYLAGSWEEVEAPSFTSDAEILIVRLARKVDEEILNKFPRLSKIFSATTGHDHIDEAAIAERKIELVSLRGHEEFLRTIPSTAEHTWALMMSLIRYIPSANEHVRSGAWDRDQFRSYQLQGKILGIIGYGRTGQKIATYARAFNMSVIYYDPNVSLDPDCKRASMKDVFQQADILSFHVHLNEETTHLLNQENIGFIKPGTYLLNTSRGKIWEESAVAQALEKKAIKGVAVDVLAEEMESEKLSPLRQALVDGQNIIITPHIAGATWDAISTCEEFLVKNMLGLSKN